MALASGLGFQKISNWSYDPRYEMRCNPLAFQEGDHVFVNLDYLSGFITELKKTPPTAKFILITHNADTPFSEAHYNAVRKYVHRIYAINNTYQSGTQTPEVITIPLAFQDYPQNHFRLILEKSLQRDKSERNTLLYMNFTLRTNPVKRRACKEAFENLRWVTKEEGIDKGVFMQRMLETKYVLCPEGTGIDCHRVYEAMICGAIPVILKSGTEMDKFFNWLPVMLVDAWSDVTEDGLQSEYDWRREKLFSWMRENPRWIFADYWLQRMHFITFGDEKYAGTLARLKGEAVASGWFNSVTVYGPKDFGDDFKHKEFAAKSSRGYGYWIWKLYFVLKKLREIKYGDILVYGDAGCSVNKKGQDRLFNTYLASLNNPATDKDIIVFQMEHLEYKYTKSNVFERFNASETTRSSGQIVGGILFIRKTDRIVTLLEMLHSVAGEENYAYINDAPTTTPRHPQFIDHRHDQSIFSVGIKELYADNAIIIPEETWASNWSDVAHVPLLATRIRRA